MQKLFDLFKELGYSDLYFRQGSLGDEEYPDAFFTYWNIDSPNDSFYDNKETRNIMYIQVCFYSNNVDLTYSKMDEFIKLSKDNGLVVQGKAQDTPADKQGFTGRRVYLRIINKLEV